MNRAESTIKRIEESNEKATKAIPRRELSFNEIRHFMYHATFRANLASIKQFGLGAKQPKNWEFSQDGVLCFSSNPDIAYSFCECADDVSESKYNSGIVVLATPYMPGYVMMEDMNCQGQQSCFCMKGIGIKPTALYVVTTKNGKLYLEGRLSDLKRVPSYE